MAIGLLMIGRAASAWESEPATLEFVGGHDLSKSLEYDSGWLPKGSPLAIQIAITRNEAEQGLLTEMSAVSNVSWPDALTLSVEGVAGEGWFALLTDLHLAANVQFDVFGYKFGDELWGYDLRMEDEATFDPMLLPGGPVDRVDLTGSAAPFTWSYLTSVFTGVDLGINLDVTPIGYATLTGTDLQALADDADAPAVLTEAGATALLPLPAENPGVLGIAYTWNGALDGALSISFRPALEVCVLGACFEVLAFDLPVDLVSVDDVFSIGPVAAEFPLPALDPVPASHDFGDVEIGSIATWELPLRDLGVLDVEGAAVASGASFTVFPEGFVATPTTDDGIVITFAPSTSGLQVGVLTLTTNDPLLGTVIVDLQGSGTLPPVDDPTAPTNETDTQFVDDEDYITKTCGCASGTRPIGWTALGLLLVVVRRRGTGWVHR